MGESADRPSILVTGATGFVGRHAIEAIRARLPGATIHAGPADILDADALPRSVAEARPDACLHLAAVAAIPDARSDPDRAWAVNLGGTLRLARALLTEAPRCRLVFAGSADIYGGSFGTGLPLDHTAVPAPLNTYAATKAAADLALGAMAVSDGLNVIRLRPFNHTGPGQRPDFVVAAFARQIARIEAGLQDPVLSVGNLDPERDFLDVRDVARAYASVIALPPDAIAPGSILNLSSGTPRRIGDVLSALIAHAGVPVTVRSDPGRVRRNDVERAIGDSTEASRLLGWSPTVPWSRTLADVLDDWRARIRDGAT